ncbi:MAG TPA: tetratricopeptide repeat protein [Candidatus Baltobacteraceae bacterium]|jgi:TPR repeat protein|nr:tetratricopeptide repeat protein [Candidatus Baltobacteraceae bacterium]
MPDYLRVLTDFQSVDTTSFEGSLGVLFDASMRSSWAEARFCQALYSAESQCRSVGAGISKWKTLEPQSYLATLCRGIWLSCQAWKLRGSTPYDKLSDWQQKDYEKLHEQARGAFEESLKLHGTPWPTYLWLGKLDTGGGMDPPKIELGKYPDWYTRGLSIFPDSETLRECIIRGLRSEWSLSGDVLRSYLDEPENNRLDAESKARLRALAYSLIARFRLKIHKDVPGALAQVEQGLTEFPDNPPLRILHLEILCIQDRKPEIIPAVQLAASASALDIYGPGETFWRHRLVEIFDDYAITWKRFYDIVEYGGRTGHLRSLRILGDAYRWGIYGCDSNHETAVTWYERASDEGDAYAEFRLFETFWSGFPGPIDRKRAISHLFAAAQRRDANACWTIWTLFEKGDLNQFLPEFTFLDAAGFLRQAIRCGSIDARTDAGLALEQGKIEQSASGDFIPHQGTPSRETVRHALEWFLEAAEGGNAVAQLHCALLFESGGAGDVDLIAAFHWCLASAKQEDLAAQIRVADGYLHGRGTVRDFNAAREWFQKAFDRGDKRAKRRLSQLNSPPLIREIRVWLDI